jgi:ribosomal protein S18 acetylase RimI-like enzyme
MTTKITIQSVDQRIESKAREIHSVQMLAYAQEAKLLEAAYFPPLLVTPEDIEASKEQFFAAFKGEKLVGAISVEANSKFRGWDIASLVVHPLFQRQGVASLLLTDVLIQFGNKDIRVLTGATNLPALALYQRYGFIETDRFLVDNQPLEIVQLCRRVSATT